MPRLRFCATCNDLFEPTAAQVRNRKARHCPKCAKGNDPRHSAEYRRNRRAAMRRARGRCQRCGSKDRLECHHRDGNNSNHDLVNLEILCHSHHVQATNELRLGNQIKLTIQEQLGLAGQGGGSAPGSRPSKLHPAEPVPVPSRCSGTRLV